MAIAIERVETPDRLQATQEYVHVVMSKPFLWSHGAAVIEACVALQNAWGEPVNDMYNPKADRILDRNQAMVVPFVLALGGLGTRSIEHQPTPEDFRAVAHIVKDGALNKRSGNSLVRESTVRALWIRETRGPIADTGETIDKGARDIISRSHVFGQFVLPKILKAGL